jgi:hypothetical protein
LMDRPLREPPGIRIFMTIFQGLHPLFSRRNVI